jgi:AcrR family transcriptional regulator
MVEARPPEASRCSSLRRTRSDAERNKLALLGAAQALYADHGVDVSLEEIARRAGVGIGTLYRHFPRGKEQLVAEALVGQIGRYLTAAQNALAAADPWKGFVAFVQEICAMQEGDLGLSDLLAMALPANQQVEQLRRQANELVVRLIERAKQTGKLRANFAGEDLLLLLIANASVVQVTRAGAPGASRRLVSLFLAAAGTAEARVRLAAAPSSDQMIEAMARLAADRGCASPG